MNALTYFVKKNIPRNDTEEAVKFMLKQGIIPFTVIRRMEILKTFQETFQKLSNGKDRAFRDRDALRRKAAEITALMHKVHFTEVYRVIKAFKSLK